MSEDGLVYGMGLDAMVEPDFPALTLAEADEVVPGGAAEIIWRSARPLSATAKVRTGSGDVVIVKRLPAKLRPLSALAEEHTFMTTLRESGAPVPTVSAAALGDFSYEIQSLGIGDDLYQGTFSWSPYLSVAHAEAAGRGLAELHATSRSHQAPQRPARPLLARFTVASSPDPIGAVELIASQRPELAAFLDGRDWRGDMARVHLPAIHRLQPYLPDLEPQWTHNDWHGTNLLWSGPADAPRVSTVFDFGLADRTTAIHDLAIAVERCAVDWISIRDGGPANVQGEQVRALLDGYRSVRPLTTAERRALPLLFPLAHLEYELSEIDYFVSCLPEPNVKNAEIAYEDYFLGHTEWSKTEEAQGLLGLLSV